MNDWISLVAATYSRCRWRCSNKDVVPNMAQFVSPLVSVHGRSRLPDPDCLLYPSSPPVVFSVYDSSPLPVYHAIVSVDVVGDC